MENGNFFNKLNVCCGITFVVLHAISWPSFVVWILIDVGLLCFLILPRVLQFIRKTPTHVDAMIPGSVKYGRGGFSSVTSEALSSQTCNTSEGSRIRSSSRRTKYNHEFSRCTPDRRDTRTPLPTISAIRNRLSYSTAEASIRSTTPSCFNPSVTNTLQERNQALHNPSRSISHNYTPNESRSSSVLHIARTNLPVAREACSPVIVKVAPLGTSPRLDLVEPKHNLDSCSKDVVVNALKQITQKRKRVYPLSDSREDDSSFLDSLPSVKKSRQEATQQMVKRTWTKAAITNESFSKPPMPETKKRKASSDVTGKPPSLVQESTVILPPARTSQTEKNHDGKDTEETKNTTPPTDKEVTQIRNTSDKENKSVDNKNELLSEQMDKIPFGILKKLRTVYPSSKPSVDAMRRKYPILCSSGVAPKLGRQSSKLKYEDYVKDREDVYAKVKRVLEEVDEAESQKKKEKPPAPSESAGAQSGTVKSVSSASTLSQLNVTASAPVQSVELKTDKTFPSISSMASACSTVAPPPNVVISSTLGKIVPIAVSSSGQQPSVVLPVPILGKLTSQPAEATTSIVTSNNLTVPAMPSLVGSTTSSTSKTFNFALPNALSTGNTSNSQIKQPTLNFSMPISPMTTSSSTAGLSIPSSLRMGTAPSVLSSLVAGTTLGVSSSPGTGLSLPSLSSGAGLKLQLPTNATTSNANTLQLQTNLLHTTNTVAISNGQMFSANTTGTNINFSASNKTSIFPALATATTTNAVSSTGSLFTSSTSGKEVASLPQSNSVFGATFNSSNQPNVTSVNNFTGLFASGTPVNSSVGNNVIASSTSGKPFGNLFGNPQTTIINTATNTITTTSGQPFIFNILQSSHTTAAPSNPTQFGGQMAPAQAQPSFSNTSTLFNQPQTQASNRGFNFMTTNTTNTASDFSFNLQPSVDGANSSLLFAAPPGGFNLPSTAAAQPRRKTKTPTRSKPKRK